MSNAVLADLDLLSDFMAVLVRHGHIHDADAIGHGRWAVRHSAGGPKTPLSAEQVEELVMDHLISALAARGLANDDF
ncbi:hypothetical protein ACFVVU_37325 [Kitasatospora sp. NPDC057965]|uniref:hypothetical protein n=1 Tax=Kitasatospora sp. NPDC057965 TaxID=3346291 RepID=UPI0036D786DA